MKINRVNRNNGGRSHCETLANLLQQVFQVAGLGGWLHFDRAEGEEHATGIQIGRPPLAGAVLGNSNSVFEPCFSCILIRTIAGRAGAEWRHTKQLLKDSAGALDSSALMVLR